MSATKSFAISKHTVWEAYRRVRTNRGEAGIDGQTIRDFERNLKRNLYKIWNRMSSGSYFPPPVRVVEIPKGDGKMRKLGIPSVSDRIAQMVAKLYLEPQVEPQFHEDSFGYRPNKSAVEAVKVTRRRCWRFAWVLDLDIKGFFDNIDHDLMMKAVEKHTNCKWLLLYVKRWLQAPAQAAGRKLQQREKGTPQGGVISPLLANLFLHYAFDEWMRRNYPSLLFERYADDMVVHCRSEKEAHYIRSVIEIRLVECKLALHPEKTKVVFCKDDRRTGNYQNEQFDFLGFTFRPRTIRAQDGRYVVSFRPAVSQKSRKTFRAKLRNLKAKCNMQADIESVSRVINPVILGWMNYFGSVSKWEAYSSLAYVNAFLFRWTVDKYKRFRQRKKGAWKWLQRIAKDEPGLFPHWCCVSIARLPGR